MIGITPWPFWVELRQAGATAEDGEHTHKKPLPSGAWEGSVRGGRGTFT